MPHNLSDVKTTAKKRAALCYADRGFPVFPCHTFDGIRCSCARKSACSKPGMHPVELPTSQRATTDADTIDMWWGEWPNANVATPLGASYGLAALWVEVPNGLKALKAKSDELGAMPRPEAVCRNAQAFYYFYRSLPLSGQWMDGVRLMYNHPDSPHRGFFAMLPPSRCAGGKFEWAPV